MKKKRSIPEWGKQCKVQMVLLGKTLADVSSTTGLGRTYISAIINGRSIAPDETIKKISKALEVDPSLYQ